TAGAGIQLRVADPKEPPMTYRKLILAGLFVALAAPAISSAAPILRVENPNPRRTPEPLPAGFYLLHKQAMDRGVSHIEASAVAAHALRSGGAAALDAGWSLRHKQAMDKGASHIDASM